MNKMLANQEKPLKRLRIAHRFDEKLRQSESNFNMIADNMAQLAWICDKGLGNVTWYNKRWLEYTGMSFGEMRGWDWSKVQHPDHLARVVAGVKHSAETGEPWEDTFPLRGRDGKYRWFLSRAIPIRDEAGSIVSWFGTNTDVTATVEAEAALRKSEERQAFLLKLSDAMRPLDDAIAIQETASRMLGEHLDVARVGYGEMEPNDEFMVVERDWTRPGVPSIAGRFRIDDFGMFFTGPLRAGQIATIEDAASDPRIDPNIYVSVWSAIGVRSAIACPIMKHGKLVSRFFIHHDCPRQWSEAETSLVLDVADRTWEAVERAHTESALQERQERLRKVERLAAAGQLAASLAHEINNPLSSVTNALYLLETHPGLDGPAREYAAMAAGELARVSRIVKQSLSYYRIGTIPVRLSLGQIATDSLQIYGGKLERAGIEVKEDIRNRSVILGLPDELRQVIDNLLLNALQAMPEGGRLTVSVHDSFELRDTYRRKGVRITIADTGCGIPKENRQRIFEPFFTTKTEKGTGLGLWVLQGIVAKHEGTISLRSSDRKGGSGTVISVFLPSYSPALSRLKRSEG